MQSNSALEYDYSIAKLFLFATIVFGIVGLLLGVIIAFQMAFPNLNYLAGEFGTFGRLRPLFHIKWYLGSLVLLGTKSFENFIQ